MQIMSRTGQGRRQLTIVGATEQIEVTDKELDMQNLVECSMMCVQVSRYVQAEGRAYLVLGCVGEYSPSLAHCAADLQVTSLPPCSLLALLLPVSARI